MLCNIIQVINSSIFQQQRLDLSQGEEIMCDTQGYLVLDQGSSDQSRPAVGKDSQSNTCNELRSSDRKRKPDDRRSELMELSRMGC